ncbi:alpha-L-rhamnosidase [Paenibacillus taihuensis]|uniref:alpha-L-rhamnosidase n=1 Tax=Paenibacillus taihuensis TaxID=1156355 RepID=A0A3D9QV46_9BACL|nr:alpha-L-rhamnosidase [Paenibacillus taihuensis]REE68104.1 alpha-L-rhamnosidase [Paenibacillus taihuensis]
MFGSIQPYDLRTDNAAEPLGIGSLQPLFSWKLNASLRAQRQSAYRIIVGTNEERLRYDLGPFCWDSDKVKSDETLQIRYGGSPLASGQHYYWKVIVWDGEGNAAAEWSPVAWFETGLLHSEDWQGEWIGGNTRTNPLDGGTWIGQPFALPVGETPARSIYYRKVLHLSADHKAVRQALFYGTCGTPFIVYVNGSTIAKLNVRWKQDYTSPFVYIDFTPKLLDGANCLACEAENTASPYAGFIGRFELHYEDGTYEIVDTDSTWSVSNRAIDGWKLADSIDFDAQSAVILASYGDAPWGCIRRRGPAPLLRKEFRIAKEVLHARLHIACLGYFEATLNGQRVGNELLQPDYTHFPKRTYSVTLDCDGLLELGDNCIGLELGRGHYAYGKDWIGDNFSQEEPTTGTIEPKAIAQLRLSYTDGTEETIATDATWLTADGPTLDDNVWYGDKYDARLEQRGWNRAGYPVEEWAQVRRLTPYTGAIEATVSPPIRIVDTIPCAYISNPKPNTYIYDAGKITAGWARITSAAPTGTSVKLIYGEKLRADGVLDIWKDGYDHQFWENAQEDVYVAKGEGTECWEPKFSYKGFRYVQVESAVQPVQLEARIFHNDLDKIGEFECSNPLFNRIDQVMTNTMLNNFHSIPTDTPFHEKRGWTGDGHLIADCASMSFDMSSFYAKWVQDIADSQQESGGIAHTCPGPFLYLDPTPAWMSAFIIIPWALFEYYGDRETLREHYAEMKRYLQFELDRLFDGVSSDKSYADWAVPGPFIGPEGGSLLATAYVFRCCTLMSRIAGVLGHESDVESFTAAEERLKAAINAKFYDREQQVYHTEIEAGYRQTSNVLAVAFGITPVEDIPAVIDNLAQDVMLRKAGHLNTGCFGTKYLAPVLTENGKGDVAYTIATQETYPSWGYCLARGATAFWESWEEETRSFDHFFLGTIDDWFYRHLAGIQVGENGYKTSAIKPYPIEGLNSASATIDTVRGPIGSAWERTADGIRLTVTIPVNASATLYVPKLGARKLLESGIDVSAVEGVAFAGDDPEYWVLRVGSGTYQFES